jgi:hypothetical protein
MPDNNDEPDGVIQADVARLPAPTRAPSEDEMANMADTPGLTDEELDERQRRLGTRRKPAGPTGDGSSTGAMDGALETPSDVPETDVQRAAEVDPETFNADDNSGGDDDGGAEPLESSERD